jgi:hypothetical protein
MGMKGWRSRPRAKAAAEQAARIFSLAACGLSLRTSSPGHQPKRMVTALPMKLMVES